MVVLEAYTAGDVCLLTALRYMLPLRPVFARRCKSVLARACSSGRPALTGSRARTRYQPALKIDLPSASNFDPPQRLGPGRIACFRAPTLIALFEDVAVVRHPVEQGGGHFAIAKDLRPFPEGQVGGDHGRGALVECCVQVEEELSATLGEDK